VPVVTKVILVTLVIRGLDEKTKRSLRAEAIRRGLRLAQAVKEAFQLWRSYDQDAQTLSERDVNNAAYNALRQELEKYGGRRSSSLEENFSEPTIIRVPLRRTLG